MEQTKEQIIWVEIYEAKLDQKIFPLQQDAWEENKSMVNEYNYHYNLIFILSLQSFIFSTLEEHIEIILL